MTQATTPKTVFDYAYKILTTNCPDKKADLSLECSKLYKEGKISMGNPEYAQYQPHRPARPKNLVTVAPGKVKKRALIHSFCHIESYAIDLSWDILLRFANSNNSNKYKNNKYKNILNSIDNLIHKINITTINKNNKIYCVNIELPLEFYQDWLRIASEEAYHYKLWRNRLLELSSSYGSFPVHDGLWLSAISTNNCLLSRLAIVHIVLEGRGLDVSTQLYNKLIKCSDIKSGNILNNIIYPQEITHVSSGLKWFKYICNKINITNPIKLFHEIVINKFDGKLKPPFNVEAREKAGLTKDWYLPLSKH